MALPLLARRQNSEKKARATTFSLLIRERTTPTQTLGQADVKSRRPKLFAELMYTDYYWLGSAGQQMLDFCSECFSYTVASPHLGDEVIDPVSRDGRDGVGGGG